MHIYSFPFWRLSPIELSCWSFAVRVALARCLSHKQGNHSHIRKHRSRIERGRGNVGWVHLGGCPKCRLPASSQGLWQRAVFRSLPPVCSKPIPFKVTRKQACSPTLCVQLGGFSSIRLCTKRGTWESLETDGGPWAELAGNGGCGKMPPSVPLSSQTCSYSTTFLLIPLKKCTTSLG